MIARWLGCGIGVGLVIGAMPAIADPPTMEVCSPAERRDETDRERLGFSGPIKSCMIKQHAILGRKEVLRFDEAGNLIEHVQENRLGRPESRERYVYDDAGTLVEEFVYRWQADALPDTGLVRHSRYAMDGTAIVEDRIDPREGDPVRIIHRCDGDDVRRTYEYADGSVVDARVSVERDGEGRIVKSRTVDGELAEQSVVTREGPWEEHRTFLDGVCVEHVSKRRGAGGRVVEIADHRLDEGGGAWTRRRFDGAGRVTDAIEYDADGDVRSHATYEYADDAYGNWIRRTEVLADVSWYVFRALDYYE